MLLISIPGIAVSGVPCSYWWTLLTTLNYSETINLSDQKRVVMSSSNYYILKFLIFKNDYGTFHRLGKYDADQVKEGLLSSDDDLKTFFQSYK